MYTAFAYAMGKRRKNLGTRGSPEEARWLLEAEYESLKTLFPDMAFYTTYWQNSEVKENYYYAKRQ